jgi:twitching motility protein PilT
MDQPSFHKLLMFGVEKGVSDIHFEVGYPPHYRLQGELLGAVKVPALKPSDTEDIARFILETRGAAVDPHRPFAEIDASYSIPGSGRFRASIFRQRGTLGIVMRIIPVKVKSFSDLNLPPILGEIAELRRGMVLLTGATGNGKTTSIAAMLRHLNETRRAHIVTIEDPIEYLYEPGKCMIVQREIGTDTLSFRDALQAAMRQDPDVIMVGEIRDRETAEISLKAAETGHLIISAIHTPDAVATIQRFIGLFPSAEQELVRERLGDTLQAIASLRLLVARDGRGRVPAVEVLRVTRSVRECIRNAGRLGEIPELMKKGRDLYGMQLFDQHLLELVAQQRITMEVAVYAASNPEEFERSMTIE